LARDGLKGELPGLRVEIEAVSKGEVFGMNGPVDMMTSKGFKGEEEEELEADIMLRGV
jgi:hypothetical protein